jgi:serine/threonine protein kinase
MPPNLFSLEHRLALPAGFKLDRYQIIRILGYGGFGITYLAKAEPDAEVAIKELFPRDFATRTDDYRVSPHKSSDEDKLIWAKQCFLNEVGFLERLRHPNIVPIHGHFELLDTAYLVMKFIPGQHLKQWMSEHPRPSEAELRGILYPLLDGLEYIHQQSVLHRDVSPENVILTKTGQPILLDFGSARTAVSSRGLTTVVRSGYSPIEQYQSVTPQGAYTDIYALAGVMIQAVTRKEPPQAIDRTGPRDPYKPLASRFQDRYSRRFLQALDAGFAAQAADRPQNVAAWRQMFPKADHRVSAKKKEPPQKKERSEPKAGLSSRPERPKGSPQGVQKKRGLTDRKTKRVSLIWPISLVTVLGGAIALVSLVLPGVGPSPATPTRAPISSPTAVVVSSVTPTPITATLSNPFINSLQMKFVPVPRTDGRVVLFCIHQTRRKDYATVMGDLPKPGPNQIAANDSSDAPVVDVTQGQAERFCRQLSVKEGQAGRYRLPTRDEWDQAFGNQVIPWPLSGLPNAKPFGNYLDKTAFAFLKIQNPRWTDYIQDYDDGWQTTAPVMSFPENRNQFGLYDMGSNVEEWCDGSVPNNEGTLLVFRKGASWRDYEKDIITKPTTTRFTVVGARRPWIGFRCVLEVRSTEPAP